MYVCINIHAYKTFYDIFNFLLTVSWYSINFLSYIKKKKKKSSLNFCQCSRCKHKRAIVFCSLIFKFFVCKVGSWSKSWSHISFSSGNQQRLPFWKSLWKSTNFPIVVSRRKWVFPDLNSFHPTVNTKISRMHHVIKMPNCSHSLQVNSSNWLIYRHLFLLELCDNTI